MKTKRNAQIFVVVVVVVIVLGKCGRCRCHVEKLQSLRPISTCGTPLCVCVCVSCTCHCLCLRPCHCLSLFHDCATYPNGFSGLPACATLLWLCHRACNFLLQKQQQSNNVEACNKCALNHIHKARRPRRETTKTTD